MFPILQMFQVYSWVLLCFYNVHYNFLRKHKEIVCLPQMQKCYEEQHKDKQEQQINLFENKARLRNSKLMNKTIISVMGSTGTRCHSPSCITLSRPRQTPASSLSLTRARYIWSQITATRFQAQVKIYNYCYSKSWVIQKA